MAVPCGDQRDWDFAKHFGIEIKNIFKDKDINEAAYAEKDAVITNSDFLNDLPAKKAIKTAIYEIEKRGFGKDRRWWPKHSLYTEYIACTTASQKRLSQRLPVIPDPDRESPQKGP